MVGPNRFKLTGFTLLFSILFLNTASFAQSQVMGELRFIAASKAAKTSGVWIDGQYVGYLDELKDDRKVMLLPGEHQVAVRQSGYTDFTQQVVVEPGKALRLRVRMQLDPQARFPKVTSQIKLQVEPDRAAVFLDDGFVGHVREFSGLGRSMLVSPGKHRIKVTLPGYQTFETEVNLLPRQKSTIKTELVHGSITQADPLIKKQ
jgi:PEGA domain-containing protein